ncbi:NADH:ubiquinone reductase (Na(+)-transporting) subunit D, partial [Bacteroidia bacterium]|nr:NADH:ubiquinone reductase (Na(+)-transporting) subunit D [Bacteroidia bacterium]
MSDNIEKKSEPLLSKKRKELLSNPMDSDNPITIQVLGICSALAVTIALEGTVIMAIAVFFVLVMANVIISALRNTIPNRIRIIVQLVVVASLVAVVDQVL